MPENDLQIPRRTVELDPDLIHLPGIFVHRIVEGKFEKRIEKVTTRAKESV